MALIVDKLKEVIAGFRKVTEEERLKGERIAKVQEAAKRISKEVRAEKE